MAWLHVICWFFLWLLSFLIECFFFFFPCERILSFELCAVNGFFYLERFWQPTDLLLADNLGYVPEPYFTCEPFYLHLVYEDVTVYGPVRPCISDQICTQS